ncbi:MAG TPA: hypothetical protein VJS68_03315, partial [Thermoplasmata archaeon]|nr:hypothetical protein [Thermoplasmata archaeon]
SGNNPSFFLFIINGSNDTVNLAVNGNSGNSPVFAFLFFGQNDIFTASAVGGHSGNGHAQVLVQFVGTLSLLCPYGNLSGTDRVGSINWAWSNTNLSFTWWNAIGYASGPTTVPFGTGDNTIWTNDTGFIACPFTKSFVSVFSTTYQGGFLVHLNNRYLATTDLVYDQGAIIQSAQGAKPIMVSGPAFSEQRLAGGLSVHLTLVNVVGNLTAVGGTGTATISTRVVGVQSFVLSNFVGSNLLLNAPFVNITTAFPQAWIQWFGQNPQAFPNGVACTVITPISAPNTCLNPPAGVAVKLTAPLLAGQLVLTTITVAVSVS